MPAAHEQFRQRLRLRLLNLAGYQVRGEYVGEQRSSKLIAVVPHREHLDHLEVLAGLYDLNTIATVLAARDLWYARTVWGTLLPLFNLLLASTLPVTRHRQQLLQLLKSYSRGPLSATARDRQVVDSLAQRDLQQIEQTIQQGTRILFYPQGSRLGLPSNIEELSQQLRPGIIYNTAMALHEPITPVAICHEPGFEPSDKRYRSGPSVQSATNGLRRIGDTIKGRHVQPVEVVVKVGHQVSVYENGQPLSWEAVRSLLLAQWQLMLNLP